HRADVVATEAQAHLADFQSLRDPARLHVHEVGKIQARDSQHLQVFHSGSFVPVAATERRVLRLKAPRDECGKAARLFLQIVKFLEMVDAVFVIFADAEHHGRGGAHADLMSGAVNVDPIAGEALEAGDFVADFVVENFGAAAGDGIESGIAQAENRVANAEATVFGDGNDLRRGIAVEMNLRKTLLDSAQHFFVPINLQVGMQAALHQNAGAAELDGLANLFVNRIEIEDVAFLRGRTFQRAIEGAEGAIFGAEIRVINVAVDDVGDGAFGMKLSPDGVGLHADADQIIGLEHLQGLGFGKGHVNYSILTEGGGLVQMSGVALFLLHPEIFNERDHRADHCQADQDGQRRFVILREETQDMPAINESQGGLDEVANPAAEG